MSSSNGNSSNSNGEASRDEYDDLLDELDLSGGFLPLCVRQQYAKREGLTWCGRELDADEEALENVDHALYAARLGDRPCVKCMDAVRATTISAVINEGLPAKPTYNTATYNDDLEISDEIRRELNYMRQLLRPETFALIDPHFSDSDLPSILGNLPSTFPTVISGEVVGAQVINWPAMAKALQVGYYGGALEGMRDDENLTEGGIQYVTSRVIALHIDGIITAALKLSLPFTDYITGFYLAACELTLESPWADELSAEMTAKLEAAKKELELCKLDAVQDAAQETERFMRLVVTLQPEASASVNTTDGQRKKVGRPRFSRLTTFNQMITAARSLDKMPASMGTYAEMIPCLSDDDIKTDDNPKRALTPVEQSKARTRKRVRLYARFRVLQKEKFTDAKTVEDFVRNEIQGHSGC